MVQQKFFLQRQDYCHKLSPHLPPTIPVFQFICSTKGLYRVPKHYDYLPMVGEKIKNRLQ